MKLAQKIGLAYIKTRIRLLSIFSKHKAARYALEIFATPISKSIKKAPPVFDSAEKLSLVVDNNTIIGYRFNHTEGIKKRKVLILHGFESTVKNFDRYISPLIIKGYEVLAFDAPAHGDSSGNQITLPLYIKTIETIDSELGPIQSFIAHSFGGLAITHYIEKIKHTADTRIALIAPATETTTAIDSFCQLLGINNKVKEEFNRLITEITGAPPSDFSIRRAAHHILAKICWFHDNGDEVTPVNDVLKVKEDNHPNIEFHFTNGLGHRRIYREDKVIKKITDFV